MGVPAGQSFDAVDLDAFVHDRHTVYRDAILHQAIPHRGTDGDEVIDSGVLPPRERVLRNGKLDPSRANECGSRRGGGDRQCQGRHGHGMGVVRLDDAGRVLFQDALEPPGGVEIHFVSGCEGNQVCPFRHPSEQFTLRVRDEYRPVVETSQAEHRMHDLALAAAPGSGRVDVQREHSRRPQSHRDTEDLSLDEFCASVSLWPVGGAVARDAGCR